VFLNHLLENAFQIDLFLKRYLMTPFSKLSQTSFHYIDKGLLQEGILWMTQQVLSLRKQVALWVNGNLRSYALYFVMGLSVFVVLVFLK